MHKEGLEDSPLAWPWLNTGNTTLHVTIVERAGGTAIVHDVQEGCLQLYCFWIPFWKSSCGTVEFLRHSPLDVRNFYLFVALSYT